MERKVMIRDYNGSIGIEEDFCSELGFIREKHRRAMAAAQELLTKAEASGITIYDSLNCGKLGKLISYIKNGSAIVLVWASCYLEYISA